MTLDPKAALGHLPGTLRSELVEEFGKISRNYQERHWEATELDGGRFSEIVYTILNGHLNGDVYPPRASKPSNFKASCERLAEKTSYPRSARLSVPRVLVALYEIRNERGVGHVGGDVNANHMDATFVLNAAQWVMAELVRLFHSTDVDEATAVVDALVERMLPLIWEVDGVARILDSSMSLAEGTLLLLYASPQGHSDRTLAESLEQERLGNYRRVLKRLHDQRLLEFNQRTGKVRISPLGEAKVEGRLLASL